LPATPVEDDGVAATVVVAADVAAAGDGAAAPPAELVAWRVVVTSPAGDAAAAPEPVLDIPAVGTAAPHAVRRPLARPAIRRPDERR
jgi:hypothetical protein